MLFLHILLCMKKILNVVIWKFRNKSLLENKIIHSLFHAVVGLIHSFHKQRNLKIISVIALIVFTLAIIFSLPIFQIFAIVYAIFCVFITEMINTSIELVVDLVTKEYRLKAMLAKDVAAGATLIAVVQSAIIGVLIVIHYFHII